MLPAVEQLLQAQQDELQLTVQGKPMEMVNICLTLKTELQGGLIPLRALWKEAAAPWGLVPAPRQTATAREEMVCQEKFTLDIGFL